MKKFFKTGLKSKLFYSHLVLAALGVLMLIVSLIFFFWVRSNSLDLIQNMIPTNKYIKSIEVSVQESISQLKGYVTINDPSINNRRMVLWKKQIFPDLTQLDKLSKKYYDNNFQAKILNFNAKLRDLYVWQWRTAGVAHALGNSPASVFFDKNIQPLASRSLNYITAIINLQNESGKAKGFVTLADFRAAFVGGTGALGAYVYTGNQENLSKSNQLYAKADKLLSKINANQNLYGARQQSILAYLNKSFRNLLYLKLQAVQIESKQGKISSLWMKSSVLPLAKSVTKNIEEIDALQYDSLRKNAGTVEALASWTPVIILLLMVILVLIAIFVAKRQASKLVKPVSQLSRAIKKMAEDRLEDDLKVEGNDELAELTQAFNEMRALRIASDARLNAILDTALDPILVIDSKGTVQTCNAATKALLEFEPEELIGKNIKNIVPEPHKSKHDEYLKNYLATGNKKIIGTSREVEAQSKSGELIPVVLNISEIRVGDELFFSGMIKDVRAQKLADKRQKELNENLQKENEIRGLLAKIGERFQVEGALESASQDVLGFISDHFEIPIVSLYLYNAEEEELNLTAVHGFSKENAKAVKYKVGEGYVGKCAKSREEIIIKNLDSNHLLIETGLGSSAPIQCLVLPLIAERTLSAVVELYLSVELTETQREILQGALGKITVSLNSALAREKLREMFLDSQAQAEELQQQEEELRSMNEELETQASTLQESEERLKTSNQDLEEKIAYVEEQKTILDAKNKEISVKSQQLEKSSQYKSEFLANMSHELRTPLNSILILSQGLAENGENNLTSEQTEEAGVINSAGKDLLNLINDILDISKVEAGKLKVNIDAFDLETLQDNILAIFNPLAKDKGIKFSVILDDSAHVEMNSDQMRVEQILKNLISNAVKFTKEGSVEIKIKVEDGAVYFDVIDTGIGISQDKLDLVFEAFQQADGSTSREFGGTGLGLAICKQLASLLGGDVSLTSEEGKGSCFTLWLPLSRDEFVGTGKASLNQESNDDTQNDDLINAAPSDDVNVELVDDVMSELLVTESDSVSFDFEKFPGELDDDRHNVSSQDKVILVVEDDMTVIKHVVKVLHHENYKCLAAVSGEEALALVKEFLPDAVILDLGLPDMSGESVLDAILADPKTASIPVHILSGQGTDDALLEKGAVSFSQKPAEKNVLINILDSFKEENSLSGNSILMVEDDPTASQVTRKLLESTGCNVTEISSGHEALSLLASKKFDCLVLDLGLPDMDGLEFLSALQNSQSDLMPVIIYTGRELSEREKNKLAAFNAKVMIKGNDGPEKLIEEVGLFVSHVECNLPLAKQTESYVFDKDSALQAKILLVDDDVRNSFALSRALENKGYTVVLADNGQMAIDKLNNEAGISVVLMDIMMPVMDGYTAIGKIREQAEYKNLPIIALTAKAMKKDQETALESGASDYMSKPVDLNALLDKLKALTGK